MQSDVLESEENSYVTNDKFYAHHPSLSWVVTRGQKVKLSSSLARLVSGKFYSHGGWFHRMIARVKTFVPLNDVENIEVLFSALATRSSNHFNIFNFLCPTKCNLFSNYCWSTVLYHIALKLYSPEMYMGLTSPDLVILFHHMSWKDIN